MNTHRLLEVFVSASAYVIREATCSACGRPGAVVASGIRDEADALAMARGLGKVKDDPEDDDGPW